MSLSGQAGVGTGKRLGAYGDEQEKLLKFSMST